MATLRRSGNQIGFLKNPLFWATNALVLEFAAENLFAHTYSTLLGICAFAILDLWAVALGGFLIQFSRKLVKQANRKKTKRKWFPWLSGACTSWGTLFLLWGGKYIPPMVMVPLIIGVVFYTILAPSPHRKRIRFSKLKYPLCMLILGTGIIGASGFFDPQLPSLTEMLFGMFLILVPSNFFQATGEVIGEYGINESGDKRQYTAIHTLSSAIVGTLSIVVVLAKFSPTDLSLLPASLLSILIENWIGLGLIGLFVCIELLGKFAAKQEMSSAEVLMFTNVSAALVVLITIGGNILHPGIFGYISPSFSIILLTILGSVIISMSAYKLSQIRKSARPK